MKLAHPVSEERRKELEALLEREKLRFDTSATRAADSVRQNFNVARWFREHPMESTLLMIASGIVLAKTLRGEGRLRNEKIRAI